MTLPIRAARFLAALTLAGAATIASAGHADAAAAPTHVAVVVDFGNQGGVQAACVPSGGSGSAVLGADFQVQYNRTGLVALINGVGSMTPTTSLYWSYWHSSGGSWSYATTGPATFRPAAGSVEGWAYNDGRVGPAAAPSYASICAGRDPVPQPVPTHAPTVAHRPSPPPAAQPGQPGQSVQPNPSTGSTSPGGSTTSSGTRTSSAKSRSSRGRTTPSSAAAGAASAVPAGETRRTDAPSPAAAKTGNSPAPVVGTALALLAVAGLGGTAYWRLRRQKYGAG